MKRNVKPKKVVGCSNAVHRCNRDLLESRERRENGYVCSIAVLDPDLPRSGPDPGVLCFLVSRETLHPST